MKLLIDADYIVYKSCASAETEIDFGEDLIVVTSNFSDVMKNIKRELDKIKKEFFDSTLILFFSHHTNFRKKIIPGLQRSPQPQETMWLQTCYQCPGA